jgi:aldehyde dehydrogenase (NAD+)
METIDVPVSRKLNLGELNACAFVSPEKRFGESGPIHTVHSPADGVALGGLRFAGKEDYEWVVGQAAQAAAEWRKVPAPVRGDVVRQIGNVLRENKQALGELVALESGKILEEGLGEVQEMIDICDFAVGLSRQLYGLAMHSERAQHRMFEQWHPLGVVGIISSFNFPVAVWSWNTMIATVCGNATVWKPSSKTPLCAVAVMNIIDGVLRENDVPPGVFSAIIGRRDVGSLMASDTRIALLSATGSTGMGLVIGQEVAARFGRSLLELGGNNAVIVSRHADLNLAIPAIIFGAVGTAGQRCTSTRRLIVDEAIYDEVKSRLLTAYDSLSERVGHPLDPNTLIGPLIDEGAVATMMDRLEKIREEGGQLIFGGKELKGQGIYEQGTYVLPSLVEVAPDIPSIQIETFAPILYLMKYKTIEEAVALNNGVPQGLSSSIFTRDLVESEYFLSHVGSDCGIANVNIGTSGAEIGGAFGGEKETGGGRESGSDAWRAYMRRQTNTINWSDDLPLAQGIKFEI